MNALTRLSLLAACVLMAPAAHAASGSSGALSPANSAEMQSLLAGQIGKLPVRFSNHALPRCPVNAYDQLFLWNELALDTTAIDHTPVPPGETRVFGEQFGPARAARAMAIIHIAMYEAVNAVYQKYASYAGVHKVQGDLSLDTAIARSAHDTLVWLYPSQAPRLDALLAADIAIIKGSQSSLAAGNALGIAAASAIIALRTNDGSQIPDPRIGVDYFPKIGPGYWSADPVTNNQIALGAFWSQVKPFVLQSASQFRAPPPPALTSTAYTTAYLQTDALGGDPRNGTPTQRTARETLMGLYWSYDGTPALCAPPRLYNQLARTLAFQQGMSSVEDAARFLALINTALADAAISAWDGKYYYQFWRPVTAIRAAGSTGNPNTPPNPTWYPLGGAATNTHGPNFTPPFPAYPSGHAVFGGALFEILRHFWPDHRPFTFTSDEFNGRNYDIYGHLMPLHPLSYGSLTDAEYDNAESRVWIGVHWQFDADAGVHQGNQLADYVFANAFQAVPR
jgi:membrane-associated phospholipid phosphatase